MEPQTQESLPENYPSGCSKREIEKIICDLQIELKRNVSLGHEGASISAMKDSSLIQLGQTELASRFTKKYSLAALGVAILSLLIAAAAFLK